MNLKITTEV